MKKVLEVERGGEKYKVTVELIKSYTNLTSKFRVRVFHRTFKIRAPHQQTAVDKAIDMFKPFEGNPREQKKIKKSEAKLKEGMDARSKRRILKYVIYGIIVVVLFVFAASRGFLGKAFGRILPFVIIAIIIELIVTLVRRRKHKSK